MQSSQTLAKEDIIKRNNVKVIGDGNKTLMLAHGFGCDQNMWRYVVPVFEEKYKIILLDLVGTGMSDLSAFDAIKYKTLHGYAEDIVEICDFLNLSDVILVGHSVSAMICTLAHLKRPNLFSGLITLAFCVAKETEETLKVPFTVGHSDNLSRSKFAFK